MAVSGSSALLLLATTSQKKLDELGEILAGIPLKLVTPGDLDLDLAVEETGTTFVENAVLKAEAYARAAGIPALADDSGLEIDALGGAPGVYSARYAGADATDADRIALVLSQLSGVPEAERTARFRCVIALATPAGLEDTVEGRCEGVIVFAPRGSNGFGYDPIFGLPESGLTMAQLDPVAKHAISHRGQAGRAARSLLDRWLNGVPGGQ